NTLARSIVLLLLWAAGGVSAVSAAQVPEPFRGHDPDSKFSITYNDVDAILRTMVVDVGRSTRELAEPTTAKTGTRMKTKVKRSTATEGNRFYFEEFKDNEEYKQALHNVRLALEGIPGRLPLEVFNRNEQLAYWLNLYNITMLDELVQIYPERDLKKELNGKKSITAQKVLNVAGVPLSLDDIQYTILPGNYPDKPVVMYGLFQGVIGAPNIRKRAYTTENVYRLLQDNAEEFVNSNRGTYTRGGSFEVSSYYERNGHWFPNFDQDLKTHLMTYIQGPERTDLRAADRLDPDIDDWTIVDVYGTYKDIGGSFATSQAAMLDAVVSVQPDGQGGTVSTNFSVAGSSYIEKTVKVDDISPAVMDMLTQIKAKEDAANLLREGRVTVEELGVAPDAEQGTGQEVDDQ
ncbi:MAG: DUF547 domain-containing protein, partial [Xanthomonadales bacterium]|nr:DUF547 domain-containing protein [Xanthomonadales bacterium]